MKDGKFRNWAELPSDLTFSILLRVSVPDRLENAQNVCRSWRSVCKEPSLWREIDLRHLENLKSMETMCRRAVDLSRGGLLEINIENFGNNSLLAYIADRSSNLKRLRIAEFEEITKLGLMKAVTKLPLLEELELSCCRFDDVFDLKGVGFACPNLKTLKVNYVGFYYKHVECDDDALAIAESMTKLRRLQLLGNRLSHRGLIAILDNCPHLEHIDLRHGLKISVVGDVDKFEAFRGIQELSR
ncbi:unnamed protein product [Microthlaspi erraticum]|uniref:F-box domain-containing protein n=1 Tax=Microthlaspi erraticum TaxID=1685480 RepID=A0A6D2KPS9_9BRAS|nr:unnamed protein product [Microthlaspi erraticum]